MKLMKLMTHKHHTTEMNSDCWCWRNDPDSVLSAVAAAADAVPVMQGVYWLEDATGDVQTVNFFKL